MRWIPLASVLTAGVSWAAAWAWQEVEGPSVPLGLPADELQDALAAPEAVVALGERLFFLKDLSLDRSISCASCHDPAQGFTDGKALSDGVGGQKTLRNAPTILNRALGKSFLWDGRAETLEQQVLLPIEDEREMALGLEEAVARLQADAELAALFQGAFGKGPDRETLAAALAAFVRRQLQGGTPYDLFIAGEVGAMTPAERAGMWFFDSRGQCWRCHVAPNFTDEAFHNTGVGALEGLPKPGRFAITGEESDRGAFKTPTLRALTLTAPYMHDGSLATLEEVVGFYRKGGTANAHLDRHIAPIEMTDQEAANLVAFLESLSRTE